MKVERCPDCGGEVDQDEVDIGVGTMYGPASCQNCHWSQRDATVWEDKK